MNPKPPAKEILLTVLANYEHLYIENYALMTMLSTCQNQEIRDTWGTALQEVLHEPEVSASLAELHAKFDELRSQVLAAIDTEVAIGILLGLPLIGKPN